jgi:hypothetical protein
MSDLSSSIHTGKWIRVDNILLFVLILLIFMFVIFSIAFLVIGVENFLIQYIILLCGIIFGIILIYGDYMQRKNMWIKQFNFENNAVIKIINNLLTNKKVIFQKLSYEKKLPKFPINYIEIFIVNEGEYRIKIQKQTSYGTLIELGPIKENNATRIDTLKIEIDNALLPQGL